MIIFVGSDIPSFKAVCFGRGLNILLADVSSETTEGHTRNSAGKSSLVEIIHFLLGGDTDRRAALFKAPELKERSFFGVFRIAGRVVRVTRRCAAPKRILLDAKHAKRLGLEPSRDEKTGEIYVSLEDWRDCLGALWFGLPCDRAGTPFEVKRAPTFRKLFGYFARRSRDVGFAHIDRYAEDQPRGDAQVALSYLLGLDWRVPHEMLALKERGKTLATLRTAIRDGELGAVFGTSATIRPELARVEERVGRLKRRMEGFQVLESYRELADEAARIQSEMSRLTLDLSAAKETRSYLKRIVDDEKPPAYLAVKTLYEAAGIELPGTALRSFEAVEAFQSSVVENRRAYLRKQIVEAQVEEGNLERNLATAGARRSELLNELNGKGAFEDLMHIQDELGQASSRLETLREKLKNANVLENKKAEVKKDSAELELRLANDHAEHEDAIGAATVLVDHAIGALYDDRTGNLLIESTKNGPAFTLTIGGGGNMGGIDQMKVFCFDMMLFERVSDIFGGPRFFIHDSHIFDGVDPRQARSALLLGSDVALRVGGQYIVTMNSDKFEKVNDPIEPRLTSAVLPVRLTDDVHGGLFGFRFDLPT
jgi:uncharacterized protein YydD (DUF2326 family)